MNNRLKSSSGQNKKIKTKKVKKRLNPKIFIFTEGATERHYFEGFRRELREKDISLEIPKIPGRSDVSLVKEAVCRLRNNIQSGDLAFVVFDVDYNNDRARYQKIKEAKALAEKNSIVAIISNDSFELWPLLHYQPVASYKTRTELESILNKYIPGGYEKPQKNLFSILDKDPEKLNNALKRSARYSDYAENPYTNMHEIVNILQAYRIPPKGQ